MVLTNRAGIDAGEHESISERVAEHATLERVVRWAIGTGRDIRQIVKQDEFTQDVVVTYEGALYLVYDST
jgi:hypothetical protein